MAYRDKRIYAGAVLEIIQDKLFEKQKYRVRRPKQNVTPEGMQKTNQKNRWLQLLRWLNANFECGDLMLTLTHTKEPTEIEDKQIFANFLSRLRRFTLKKTGKPIKYMAWTEVDSDHRLHHHIICKNMSITPEELRKLWGQGRVDISTLDGDPYWRWLESYFVKQDKRQKFKKWWTQSKNLTRPTETPEKTIQRGDLRKPPKLPKGYILVDYQYFADSWGEEHRYIVAIRADRKAFLPQDILDRMQQRE